MHDRHACTPEEKEDFLYASCNNHAFTSGDPSPLVAAAEADKQHLRLSCVHCLCSCILILLQVAIKRAEAVKWQVMLLSHCQCSRILILMQVAVKRAEAVKWQVMQEANAGLQSQQQRLQSEIQEWKARYRDEAAYSNELQAAANRLQTELTAAQLEAQVQ